MSLDLHNEKISSYSSAIAKQKKIIVYCRSGNRSGRGTDLLIRLGFDAVNLTGGMNQWAGPVAIKKWIMDRVSNHENLVQTGSDVNSMLKKVHDTI